MTVILIYLFLQIAPRWYQLNDGVARLTIILCCGLFGFNVFPGHEGALIQSRQNGSSAVPGILVDGRDKFWSWGHPVFPYLSEATVRVGPLRSELSQACGVCA